jgi:glycosyltransferase involved in cell wall biosynthesis
MFTVVIPHFNHAKTLARALASRDEAAEWIVVDDGSAPDQCDAARRLAADHGARFIDLGANRGPAVARNRGAAEATEHYLVFLDADDLLLGGFGTEVQAFLRLNPGVDAVHPAVRYADLPEDVADDFDDLRRQSSDMVTPSGLVVRREVFLKMGGFPDDPVFLGSVGGEDVAFVNALGEVADYRYWPRPLVQAHAGRHLITYLQRTRVENGTVVFSEHTPEESRGDLARALASYRSRVRARMADASL